MFSWRGSEELKVKTLHNKFVNFSESFQGKFSLQDE